MSLSASPQINPMPNSLLGAKKAATFQPLSVSASRRVPSRLSLRSCTVNNIPPGCEVGDPTHGPWSLKPRLRSSQASVEHPSRFGRRSIRLRTPSRTVLSKENRDESAQPDRHAAKAHVCPSSVPAPVPLQVASPDLQLPVVSSLDRSPDLESRRPSFTARARRAASASKYPPITITALPAQYTFELRLPDSIKPEMVTITTAKGDRLKIVADAWHLEVDCHYEWQIVFSPRDVDMSSIRAKFEDAQSRLTVSAGRRAQK
ncbi:hypothetical protein C8J57DRAFT_1272123 [Mycena rebaudengoi]|nr:hypothetical protein C8J57DRAFT_1272123 [Mycena rebaudengoi]